jgi:L-fuculose-phosphate aldolase
MPPDSPALPDAAIAALRDDVVRVGRRLGARGLISAGEGNISCRVGGGSILITPSGRRKDELVAADVLQVLVRAAMDAGTGRPRPSSDMAIHRAAYEARSDIGAVVHAHLPAAMALTVAGQVPDPAILPETALLLPRLPYLPYDTPGSADLASAVAAALAAGPEPLPGAVLLERHGAVAVGETLDEAVNRLELVEVLCRTWRDALLIRAAVSGPSDAAILPPRRER